MILSPGWHSVAGWARNLRGSVRLSGHVGRVCRFTGTGREHGVSYGCGG